MTAMRLLLLCGLILTLVVGLTEASPGSARAPDTQWSLMPTSHEPPCPSEGLCGAEAPRRPWETPDKQPWTARNHQPEITPTSLAPRNTGGPDAFGYTYDDSVAYHWNDATGGSQGPTGDDNYGGPYPLRFTFNFYGASYTEFYVGTNGIVSFGNGSSDLSNDPMPLRGTPNNLVAPFWDDLNPSAGGTIYYRHYGSAPNRYTAIEWDEVYHYGTTDPLTFEVILYENENGNIKFQYHTMIGDRGDGDSATVGIENDAGDIGLEYSYNSNRISDGLAVLFTYPTAQPNVWLRPQVGGAMVPRGSTAVYSLQVLNIGLSGNDTFDLTSSSSWPLTLYDASGTIPLTDTDGDGTVDTGPVSQGESVTIVATIEVPASAGTGQGTSATVRASSSRSPARHSTATLNTAIPGSFAQAYFENYAADGSTDWENYLDLNQPTGLTRRQITNDDERTEYTAVDVTADGKIVYAWDRERSNGSAYVAEIEYTVLDPAGGTVVPLTKLTDHSLVTSDIYDFSPAVATFPDGNTIIAWARQPHPSNVYYAIYDSTGGVVKGPTALTRNSDADYPRDYPPAVATTEDGRAVLAWEHANEAADGRIIVDVQYAVLDSHGRTVKSITNLTNNSGDYDDFTPRLASLSNNRVLVDWSGEYYNTYISEICYAILDSAGRVVRGEKPLTNSGASAENSDPDAVSLSDGRIAVAWSRAGASSMEIQYALLSSTYGVVVGPTTLPNPAAQYNSYVSLAADDVGSANLTWRDGDVWDRLYFAALNNDGTVRAPATIYRQAQNSYIWSSWNGYGNAPLNATNIGPTLSRAYLPMISHQFSTITVSPIRNGGFEAGSFDGWTHGGQLARSISTVVARSGTHSALLGDPDYDCQGGVPVGSAWMSQIIAVPASGRPALSFWYRVFSQDRLSDIKYDSFDVHLNETLILRTGNTTATYGCDQPTTDTGWQFFTRDLSAYRGQTVELRFENASRPDGWYNTWTYVDDVQLNP